MADDKRPAEVSPDESVLVKQMEAIEQRLHRIEVLRKRLRYVMLAGALMLLVLLGAFAVRLFSHVARYQRYISRFDQQAFAKALFDSDADVSALTFSAASDPEMDEAVRTAIKDSRLALSQEMDLIRKTLADEIIPDFCSKVGSRFQEQLPELEKNAIMAGQHLGEFAKQYMEKRLSAALERGIKSSNSEIQTIFPNLDERALMKSLDEGKEAFIEQLHEVLEERYAMVASHLDGLKATAEAVAKSKGHEELVAMIHQAPARGKGEPAVDPAAAVKDRLVDPEVLGEIEARLVETLLELAIYELDPKKGDLLVK